MDGSDMLPAIALLLLGLAAAATTSPSELLSSTPITLSKHKVCPVSKSDTPDSEDELLDCQNRCDVGSALPASFLSHVFRYRTVTNPAVQSETAVQSENSYTART